MASGRTHFVANVTVLVVSTVALVYYDVPAQIALPVEAGLVAGTVITPDFDVDHPTYTRRLLLSVPVIGELFVATWYPYALRFGHRGVSHDWLLGTATRASYGILAVLFWLLVWTGVCAVFEWQRLAPLQSGDAAVLAYLAFWMYLGWWLQDLVHLIFDRSLFVRRRAAEGG
jgi:uncharacterized metal-binding protein